MRKKHYTEHLTFHPRKLSNGTLVNKALQLLRVLGDYFDSRKYIASFETNYNLAELLNFSESVEEICMSNGYNLYTAAKFYALTTKHNKHVVCCLET